MAHAHAQSVCTRPPPEGAWVYTCTYEAMAITVTTNVHGLEHLDIVRLYAKTIEQDELAL